MYWVPTVGAAMEESDLPSCPAVEETVVGRPEPAMSPTIEVDKRLRSGVRSSTRRSVDVGDLAARGPQGDGS